MLRVIGLFCLLALCAGLPLWAAETPASTAVGLTFKALDPADLDVIAESIGKRAGVMVEAVAKNSNAERAGFKQGEVVLKIGETLVDSPAAAEKALAAAKDAVDTIGFLVDANGTPAVAKHTLTLVKGDAGAKPVDPELQKKLQALEDAHKAGILSDAEYAKKRTELLAKAAPKESKYLAASKGKTYAHAIGFSFWYPDGWTVADMGDGLQLTPPNAATKDGQAQEMYFITGQPLEGTGVTAISDPKIAPVLDLFVQGKISSAMQRKKEPAAVTMTNGQGMLYEWDAAGLNNATVHTRIYACVLKNWGVMFVAVGAKDIVVKREAEMKAIFNSFGFEAGKQDPAVVGAWFLLATRELRNEDNVNFTSDDPRRATSVSDEQITVELRADGSVTRTSIYRMIAGGGAAGGAGKVWIDTGDQKTVTQGRWNAGNGTLVLMWQDGAMESCRYGLVAQQGGVPSMKLLAGKQVQFWQRK